MGPVGQIVRIIFYVILATELVFSIAIYGMATLLLCSRMIIPEHILLHGALALFLSILTLSVIHRGFQAVSHDCPYHLYWFAVIFIILLLVQFMFEMFGIRATSRKVWQKQSLPLRKEHFPTVSKNSNEKEIEMENMLDLNHSVEYTEEVDTKKMAYRIPTAEELEARKRKLYGPKHETDERPKYYTMQPHYEDEYDDDQHHITHRPPIYRGRGKVPPDKIHRVGGGRSKSHDVGHHNYEDDDRGVHTRMEKRPPKHRTHEVVKEEKLTNTPLVLVFHGYSFILKMICAALAVLTGFMYQLEYI